MPFLVLNRVGVVWRVAFAVFAGGELLSDGAELEGLEGRWKVVAGEVDGKRMPSKGLAYYVIGDKRMTFSNGIQEREFDFSIKVDTVPMEMDQIMRVGEEVLVTRCIFALEGDTLKLCGSVLPGKPRPARFGTQAGDDLVLFELERVGEEEVVLADVKAQPQFIALQKIGARFELNAAGQVRTVLLSTTKVTDDDLEALTKFPSLTSVSLALTGVGDKGLKSIGALQRLERLNLSHTRVTDKGLRRLTALTALEVLQVSGARVTAKGLLELKGLPKLREVDLDLDRVGESDVARLRRAMPQCVFK